MKKKKLGEVLRERGHITPSDLSKAIADQQGKVIRLGELMLERGMVTKEALGSALTEVTHLPYVDVASAEVDVEVLKLLPYAVGKRCCVLPLHIEGTKLVVVMAEPQNLQTLNELRFMSGMDVQPRIGFRSEILTAIERLYNPPSADGEESVEGASAIAELQDTGDPLQEAGMEFVSTSSLQRNIEAMQEMQAELLNKSTPAVRMVAATIAAAAAKQASDIHIEPQSQDTLVRLRVDGMLREHVRLPRALQNSVVSRIKILSDMDIAERRAPQDGRFLVKIAGRKIDLRVSTLPTQWGEKVVMRLLEADAPLQGFSALGLAPEIADALVRILALPQGMLLVTGPTGSGKSTTLYSSLNFVRKPSVNIITVEDPVEYAVPGINQVQVNTKTGLTFASCLRSILRQDPNVIMVGEIRDRETAEIAIKAAQTGHLVLSTLHTNDSISAVTRLLDLEVPGFQIATSVSAVIAQRLVRRLCTCHAEIAATPEHTTRAVRAGISPVPQTQRIPVGCDLCDQTGYKGRVGIYEMLVLDDPIRSAIRSGGKTDEIRALARNAGMRLMQEYALDRVTEGITTLDEILRVVPFEPIHAALCASCHRELSPAFGFCPFCGEKRRAATHLVEEGALQQ